MKNTKSKSKQFDSAGDWPGGMFIVKRSIIDLFTNLVPWLVGVLAFTPLFAALMLQYGSVNSGDRTLVNIASIVLGVIGVAALLYTIACWIASTPVYGLARADGKKMTTKEVFTMRGGITWRLVGVAIVLGVALLAGFLLFVIPGIILAIWLMPAMVLVPYVVVEEKLGVIASIKRAHQLGKGHAMKAWGIIGWFFLLSVLLMIPFVLLMFALFSRDASAASSSTTASGDSSQSGGSPSGFGLNPLSAISFAYLYRWIKQQPSQ